MKQTVYKVLNKIYAITMSVSFFAGLLPLFPFIAALIIGGEWGEKISVFLYQQYYPWVIVLGCVSIVIGLIAMYIAKIEALSVKNTTAEEKKEQ